jgi:hypothetical protein
MRKLTSVGEEELDDDQGHVDRIVLVSNGVESNGVDPSDIRAHDLVDGVPDEQTLGSHRVSLDLRGVRPEDWVGEIEDGEVQPDEDDCRNGCSLVAFSGFGINSTGRSAQSLSTNANGHTWMHTIRRGRQGA